MNKEHMYALNYMRVCGLIFFVEQRDHYLDVRHQVQLFKASSAAITYWTKYELCTISMNFGMQYGVIVLQLQWNNDFIIMEPETVCDS